VKQSLRSASAEAKHLQRLPGASTFHAAAAGHDRRDEPKTMQAGRTPGLAGRTPGQRSWRKNTGGRGLVNGGRDGWEYFSG
jgi:hypothetical protein